MERKYQLIDIAVPGDKKIEMKEQEKIESHCELKREGSEQDLEYVSSWSGPDYCRSPGGNIEKAK